jgi:integrase
MQTTTFGVLCEKYLNILEHGDLRPATLRRYWAHYRRLEWYLGSRQVKHITYAVLEDTKVRISDLAPKTVYDMFGFLKTFLVWCVKREDIDLKVVPPFPKLSKYMGLRKIVDKETQANIIEKIKTLYVHAPKAHLGAQILATYPKIRPGELMQVTEAHLDLTDGWITIPAPKEQREPKKIKLTDKHITLLRANVSGNPDRKLLSFEDGRPFGRDYLYDAWTKACRELGIEGISLYAGTKHSTATALAKVYPYKMVKEAAGVSSRAMERYINISEEDVVALYESASEEL